MPYKKHEESYSDYRSPWGSVNTALTHESGDLTDQMLQDLPLMNLRLLAYGYDDTVQAELYRRPDNKTITEKSGGFPREVFSAPHRALFELQRREKEASLKTRQADRKDERTTMLSLLRGYYSHRGFKFLGGMFSEKMNFLIRKFAIYPKELGFSSDTWDKVVNSEKKN